MSTKPPNDDLSEVGQNLFYGINVKRSYRKAFPYLLEAANRGEIHAQNLVGYCYGLGLGVKKDRLQAIFWYQQAAKYHHEEALFNLGVSYDKGNGAEDLKKALSFYKRAAALGHDGAQCNLGVNYLEGLGTRRNLTKGIEWMRKAARNGSVVAQYNLGMAYLDGEGVRPNKRNARLWLQKAANQGHKKAVSALRRAR